MIGNLVQIDMPEIVRGSAGTEMHLPTSADDTPDTHPTIAPTADMTNPRGSFIYPVFGTGKCQGTGGVSYMDPETKTIPARAAWKSPDSPPGYGCVNFSTQWEPLNSPENKPAYGAFGKPLKPEEELYYMNMRWPYNTKLLGYLQPYYFEKRVIVFNKTNNRYLVAVIGDYGPNASTGHIAGLSPEAKYALDANDDTELVFGFAVDQTLAPGPYTVLAPPSISGAITQTNTQSGIMTQPSAAQSGISTSQPSM